MTYRYCTISCETVDQDVCLGGLDGVIQKKIWILDMLESEDGGENYKLVDTRYLNKFSSAENVGQDFITNGLTPIEF